MSALNALRTSGPTYALVALFLLMIPVELLKAQRREAMPSANPETVSANVRPLISQSGPGQQPARRKRALLVGISKYEKPIKNGTPLADLVVKNDMELLADVLVRRFEFKPEDIKIISDEPVEVGGKTVPSVNPTRLAITETFHSFLIAQTDPGDVALFHFSGHGCQVPDDDAGMSGVADELDGLDETLVPSDYVSKEDGSNNIRDDHIANLLTQLSKKKPSSMTITIDSCFSGTATRGTYDVMRGCESGAKPRPKRNVQGEDETFSDFVTVARSRVERPQQICVFLSAASSRQHAKQEFFEGKKYGVFTYFLAKAMRSADSTTTYRDIYERVLDDVNSGRDQRPQIEGQHLDNLIFDVGALPPESYIPVKVNGDVITLMAGALQGMTVGSKFALHPPGTKSPGEGKPLAQARVIKVRASDSTLELEGGVAPKQITNTARAFEVSRNYQSLLKVALKDVESFAGLNETLKELGLAATIPESSPEWNVLVRATVQADRNERIVPPGFRGVILQRRDGGSILARIEAGEGMLRQIKSALITEAKRITLRSLDNTDPKIKIEIRLIPIQVDWKLDSTGQTVVTKVIGDKQGGLKYSKGGTIEFKLDDFFRIEVRNVSDTSVYVTVLNLNADGKINPVFPRAGMDNLIKRADSPLNKNSGWLTVRYLRVVKPIGLESIRAIATREATDFSPLFDPGIIDRWQGRGGAFSEELLKEAMKIRSDNQRGGEGAARRLAAAIKSPLGQVLIATQEGRAVSGPASNMPPPSWSTATVSYVVVK
jgi:hypothetical protein